MLAPGIQLSPSIGLGSDWPGCGLTATSKPLVSARYARTTSGTGTGTVPRSVPLLADLPLRVKVALPFRVPGQIACSQDGSTSNMRVFKEKAPEPVGDITTAILYRPAGRKGRMTRAGTARSVLESASSCVPLSEYSRSTASELGLSISRTTLAGFGTSSL